MILPHCVLAGDASQSSLAERFDMQTGLAWKPGSGPGQPHHGTWKRDADEKPSADSRQWLDFDPNWREFISTTLIRVLENFEDRLPADVVDELEHSLVLAAEGALARELPPDYSNIAVNQHSKPPHTKEERWTGSSL